MKKLSFGSSSFNGDWLRGASAPLFLFKEVNMKNIKQYKNQIVKYTKKFLRDVYYYNQSIEEKQYEEQWQNRLSEIQTKKYNYVKNSKN